MTRQQLTELSDEYAERYYGDKEYIRKQDVSDAYYTGAVRTIRAFCDKLLNEQTEVPEDIQKIINEHFFELI